MSESSEHPDLRPQHRDEGKGEIESGDEEKTNSSWDAPTLDQDGTGDSGRAAGQESAGRLAAGEIAEKAGSIIGPYKLLRPLGEGGFGVVYLAEQREPVKRKVALKIIKPGMDSREVIARFEAERQALALMDHPGIANVFDAGATETGRPYFVMERVKGVPVTDFCDSHRLDTGRRLELMREICSAVQHAHQKGVIHRDLKPSNILVTTQGDRPVVKVIDFGVAKSVSRELTDRTLCTTLGQMIGTPHYMSPEQAEASGLDIDTRSDVYSLGVVLYELLTGRTPLDPAEMRRAGLEEMYRLIREGESPRPSTRIGGLSPNEIAPIARARGEPPERLAQRLRGDLDWIVMKALEKDRTRRYESASGFSEDIRRYIDVEPVSASPPSVTYQLRKFARRNKATLATAGVILVTLIAAVAVSSWQAVRAWKAKGAEEKQRELAEINAGEALDREEEARAVLGFFQDKVLSAARPRDQAGGLGIDVTIREAIEEAEPQIAGTFADRPLVEAAIRHTLGLTYRYQGDPEAAIRQYERALESRRELLGPEHPDILASMNNLANCYSDAERFEDALVLREETLAQRRKVLGPGHPDTLNSMNNLAISYRDAGRRREALALLEETLDQRKQLLGPEHPDTLHTMNNLAISYRDAGRFGEALELREKTLELRRKVQGPDHPDSLKSMHNLAISYRDAGRFDEALALNRETLARRKKILGPGHPLTLSSMNSLAGDYRDRGRSEAALALYEETLALRRKSLPPGHPETLDSMNNLAVAYDDAGRHVEAIPLHRETLEQRRESLGFEHPDTLISMLNLAYACGNADQFGEALELGRETLELMRKVKGPEHPHSLIVMLNLAESCRESGRLREALALNEDTLERARQALGPANPVTLSAMHGRADTLRASGRLDEAIALARETLERRREVLGEEHSATSKSLDLLARCLAEAGRPEEAETGR